MNPWTISLKHSGGRPRHTASTRSERASPTRTGRTWYALYMVREGDGEELPT